MMSGKEKLYFLLNRIGDVREIAPSKSILIIDPMNDLNGKFREVELIQLFTKLEKDEQVLKVIKVPRRTKDIDIIEDLDPFDHADDGCWHIELLSTFDNYYLKIQHEPEYQEFTGKKAPSLKPDKTTKTDKIRTKELEGQDTPQWQEDFSWQGKKFVFGEYGSTNTFNSKTRRDLLREFTKTKGNWVTVKRLKEVTNKDEAYVRPTIGQIEKSFSSSLKNHISIPSTEEDNLQPKPQEGAYRIKFTP